MLVLVHKRLGQLVWANPEEYGLVMDRKTWEIWAGVSAVQELFGV